jgi:hypothetical protein
MRYKGKVILSDPSLVVFVKEKVTITLKEKIIKPWLLLKKHKMGLVSKPDPDLTIESSDWLGNPLILKAHPKTLEKIQKLYN